MPAKANKIGFNSAACYNEILRRADVEMTHVAEKLVEIMRREVYSNGNGSHYMKIPTVALVREILHEVTDKHIRIDVGIDPAMAQAISEQTYVRVCVVLFGNQGSGSIRTKPGQETWRKHVGAKGLSAAKTSYEIPQFNQQDVSEKLIENIKTQIDVYIKDFIRVLSSWLDGNFFAQFVTVS